MTERDILITAIQVLTDTEVTVVSTFTIEGHPLVSEDGQTFTDSKPDARIIVRDATSAILLDTLVSLEVTAARITPGSLLPGSPALPVTTPMAGTPAP